MSYMHIENLYKKQDILLFKKCYATEKIHGTSAHILWKDGQLNFFSGGAKHSSFIEIFDVDKLTEKFEELGIDKIVMYGEAYGGKLQRMSHTYGNKLEFIVFEVQINNMWLSVPKAEEVANDLELEFVYYKEISSDIESIEKEMNSTSIQAIRNGVITENEFRKREGIVLRPLVELTKNNGERIIVKHKREDFIETKTKREVSPERLKILGDAKEIAKEWVTEMRLSHVIDQLNSKLSVEKIGKVIKLMIDDIRREAENEIVWSKAIPKAIGRETALIIKRRLRNRIGK